jgi:hypothetical protein
MHDLADVILGPGASLRAEGARVRHFAAERRNADGQASGERKQAASVHTFLIKQDTRAALCITNAKRNF